MAARAAGPGANGSTTGVTPVRAKAAICSRQWSAGPTAPVTAAHWAGRRPRLGGYVTGTGATRGVPAAGGR